MIDLKNIVMNKII